MALLAVMCKPLYIHRACMTGSWKPWVHASTRTLHPCDKKYRPIAVERYVYLLLQCESCPDCHTVRTSSRQV